MPRLSYWPLAGMMAAGLMSTPAQAAEIGTGNPDVRIRWDNTLKYSTGVRLRHPSATLVDGPDTVNGDDGDRNLGRGFISQRFDLLSELDIVYQRFGVRVSGAAWYDSIYNRDNDNHSPATANALSVPYYEFTRATEKLHGRKAELLDAFAFGSTEIGSTKLSFRAGRHSLLWGESLYFGDNGIAAGQAPIDAVKGLSVPGTQFKELIRPVPQVSMQLQITPRISVGAYYQFHWEETRLPGSGSYFSTSDIIGAGAERLLLGGPLIPGGGAMGLVRGPDMKPSNGGQGGVQLRLRVGESDFGLYAIRYHAKTPQLYGRFYDPAGIDPHTGLVGLYQLAYHEGIRAFGASASRSFGDWNVAAEVSMRDNMPLSSDLQDNSTGGGDNHGNALYAIGKTLHAQMSWLASFGPNFIARESDFSGEIAFNRRMSITHNPQALNPNADRDAVNIRFSYEPRYRQVLPGLDVGVPIGMGIGFGNSSMVDSFYGNHVGNINIGLNMNYLNTWQITAHYNHYFGPSGPYLVNNSVSYLQSMKDRDFIALSVQRSF
ncbi:DUF1302 domain-containing protein [Kerstersia gyiorum]|uniref:DUF1302 domain-containing protein n=1 Tax=Kerstersia gyiorum TaxID=206506 RepID=A0A171KVD2_9BURK|nr:DUF1302 domain-containing protein [Kerstersia gyiorum]KKO72849.1 hypothetical protein AAV32_00335 [Kerstersia gyiorum]MCH4271351.1 DUF1302 domain-containing protein [Kerstersia gyiorum]MCI1229647.1 DUF1302 domain-containing protein [Kerstersia gyiorum]MCR4158283.1 DUF1302 domain-containing protein [Kerstersia gyiorum]